MKTLTAKQDCFVAAWGRQYMFEIGTIEQFHNNSTYLNDEQRAAKIAAAHASNEPQATAWAMNTGACITDSQGYYDRLRAKQNAATEIAGGEVVEIEGRQYTVKLMGKNYSDPVHFVPVSTTQTAAA